MCAKYKLQDDKNEQVLGQTSLRRDTVRLSTLLSPLALGLELVPLSFEIGKPTK